MAFYFVSTFAIAQTPTKQPALRLSRTKNLHFAKATFPGFSASDELSLQGEVVSVFGSINAIHVTMDSNEKTRLSQDDRVDFIEEDILLHASSTQENPGWALDRIDEPGTTYVDDGTYEYTNDGSGRTIYILDSGLNLDIQAVADEFGNSN
jgi:serine protease